MHRLLAAIILLGVCAALVAPLGRSQAYYFGLQSAVVVNKVVTRRRREVDPDDDDSDLSTLPAGAASYSRYSSENQDERSISDQQRKCRARAEESGYTIQSHLEFVDEAISGAKHDRAGFDSMLQAAREGRITVLYVESLSRLARDAVLNMVTLRELVYRHSIRVISLDDGIDTAGNDSWELLATIFGFQNEQYLRHLAKMVFRGQEGLVLDLLCVGDYCFGYGSEAMPGSEDGKRGRKLQPKKRYIIDPAQAAWVRKIFRWFVVEKRSLRWIAGELNRQGAPKDHRATTDKWHPTLVSNLLKNPKYIGRWAWGRKRNVRDWSSGQIRQEDRSLALTDKYLRHFPELRIIDDEMFRQAGERLQQFADAVGERRRKAKDKHGRVRSVLAGSTSKRSEVYPRHLLEGLIVCGHCGGKFYVGGGYGTYMFCKNHRLGACACGTMLHRRRAEEAILKAIGDEVLADDQLLEAVLEAAWRAWQQLDEQLPAERARVEAALADVNRRLARLIDRLELGDVPDVQERLRQRRAEREALEAKLTKLNGAAALQEQRPTREWLTAQLGKLRTVFAGDDPAAAIALRELVGQVVVRQVRREGKQRHYLRGELVVRFRELSDALGAAVVEAAQDVVYKRVELEFRQTLDSEQLADEVKRRFDEGQKFRDMARELEVGRPMVASAFRHWHASRGLAVPDGRSLRRRLDKEGLAVELQPKIMDLWRDDLLIDEIAAALGCSRDIVRISVRHWHSTRNLPLPDGRTRRREIRLRREAHMAEREAG